MYTKLKPVSKASGLVLALLMVTSLGYAQSQSDAGTPKGRLTSEMPGTKVVVSTANASGTISPSLSTAAFTTWCVYHSNYAGSYNCGGIYNVHPWSRVIASVCEYSTDPNYCVQGAAYQKIWNVVPFEGRVQVGIDPNWTYYPINLRLTLLIDP
jgi:hypothetical protein